MSRGVSRLASSDSAERVIRQLETTEQIASPALSNPRHLPALDGLRGLAVLMVFILHYGGGAQSPNRILRGVGLIIKGGWSGVTLFFILSGFLISGILWDGQNRPRWWRNFYMRRTLRIFPLYYATLLLVLLVAVLTGHGRSAIAHLWIFALYLQNVPPLSNLLQYLVSPLMLSHFWSLAVEEQFYLLWPLLLLRMKTLKQARMLCLAVFLCSGLFRLAICSTTPAYGEFTGFLFSRAGELALGAYLAMSFREASVWARLHSVAIPMLLLGLAGFLSAGWAAQSLLLDTPNMIVIGLPCITVFYAALLVLSLGNGVVNRLARMAWLRWLGGISYGIYVFHVLLTEVFHKIVETIAPHASRNLALGLDFLVAGSLSVLIAWLSFRYFETPFLNLRSRYRS